MGFYISNIPKKTNFEKNKKDNLIQESPINSLYKKYNKIVSELTLLKENESVDNEIDPTNIELNYDLDDIQDAKDYSATYYQLIYPVASEEELDILYNKFKSMPIDKQLRSNDLAIELFGVDNEILYQHLKYKFSDNEGKIEDDVKNYDSISSSISEFDNICYSIRHNDSIVSLLENINTIDSIDSEKIDKETLQLSLDKSIQKINADTIITRNTMTDVPFYSPEDLIALGIYTPIGTQIINSSAEYKIKSMNTWFKSYRLAYEGFESLEYNNLSKLWIEDVSTIYQKYKNNPSESLRNDLMIYGWNPDIEFTLENRIKVNENYKKANSTNISIIDIHDLHDRLSEATFDINKAAIKPIHIVLVEGKSLFSKCIKAFTHSRFTHAAISLDEGLEHMYSYNINTDRAKSTGLSIESFKQYPAKNKMSIYTIFVKEKDFSIIKSVLDKFVENAEYTKYSFSNILALVFNIPFERDLKLICSQFVDRILKLCDIDITSKNSSLVSPAILDKKCKTNKKIYNLFKDKVSRYSPKKLAASINFLFNSRDVEPIKEQLYILSNKYLSESNLYNALEPSIFTEAKSFPIQFDNDGNLFIKNISKLDFDAEYNRSHTLLTNYEKVKNIEGIKYELSKLWMMNIILEKYIFNNVRNSKTDKYIKSRARILNDFNKYLKIVLDDDNSFVFSIYFDQSPFSDTIKIDRSTQYYTFKTMKEILKYISLPK